MTFNLETETKIYNTIALRGIVIFPGTTASFEIGRKISINALKEAESTGDCLFLVTQHDPSVVEPKENDLLNIGTLARIVNSTPLKDGSYQVVVEGIKRVRRTETIINEDIIICGVEEISTRRISPFAQERVATKELFQVFSEYLNFISKPYGQIN